jgi:dUTP pyrophosphatase
MYAKMKKLNDLAKIPHKETKFSAGMDLFAATDSEITINPGETKMIPLGFATELAPFTAALILPRSGLASKKGLRPANTPGLIDADYRGEWMVALHNDSQTVQSVMPQERIAQALFIKFYGTDFEEVDELTDTDRGEGGFGSTGVK